MNTSDLLLLYEGAHERCGFILKTGEIIEVPNICEDPENGFDMRGEDIIMFAPIATATWHTHPDADSNLSAGDYFTFLNWPELQHFIVGNDGISKYVVEEEDVLIAA